MRDEGTTYTSLKNRGIGIERRRNVDDRETRHREDREYTIESMAQANS